MEAERATIRFMAEYQAIWFRHFPDLSRRAQWHIVCHLCGKGRDGSPVGELSGIVKQLFLLDDATVRERLGELYRLGFCAIDPPDRPVSARTIILPTADLLGRFDTHLAEAAERLFVAARAVDPAIRGGRPATLDDTARRALMRSVECCTERCLAELDQGFAVAGISIARRLEAKRHLLSPSHWLLVQMGMERWYGIAQQTDDGDGVLADDLAADLLKLLRQNFQTTRDHIAYLMQLGLLERRAGRALRVALTEPVAQSLHRALGQAATELVQVAQGLAEAASSDAEQTAITHAPPEDAEGETVQHVLVASRPGEPDRQVVIGREPLIIGRAPSCGLTLPATEVSRAHCRVALSGGQASVLDLGSTNGTFVEGRRIADETPLQPGAVLQVGPYRLRYLAAELENVAEGTLRGEPAGNVTPLRSGRRGSR